MSKFTSENIGRALEIDLLTYLQTREPEELVSLGGNVFCTKTHDSLKISNGMWMWWSRGFGGKSALGYLVKVLYIKSAFAQSEALAGSKRVATAIRMKMQNGEFSISTVPYGFRAENNVLIPIPELKPIIKRIFNDYLSGKGMGTIAQELNEEKCMSKKSIGVEEYKLHEAICRALSKSLPDREEILKTIKTSLEYAVSGDNEILDKYNIELNIKQLQDEADMLMERAANTQGDTDRYFAEIEKLFEQIKALRQHLEMIQTSAEKRISDDAEIKRITDILENNSFNFSEFNDNIVRRIVECIRVMSDGSIVVILKGGYEITEKI